MAKEECVQKGEGKKGRGRTQKKTHVNLPASPSDGVGVKGAMGSSKHTRSRGILHDCSSAGPSCF